GLARVVSGSFSRVARRLTFDSSRPVSDYLPNDDEDHAQVHQADRPLRPARANDSADALDAVPNYLRLDTARTDAVRQDREPTIEASVCWPDGAIYFELSGCRG